MKKNRRNRLLCILLSLAMVLTLLPGMSLTAYADTGDILPESDYLTFTAEENDSEVSVKWSSGSNMKYSVDNGVSWTNYEQGTTINLNMDDSVRFRGSNITFNYSNHFSITGKVAGSGNVMSLRLDEYSKEQGLQENCFCYMFDRCTGLTEAPDLPATILAPYCYYNMFKGCTRLAEAPDLPATTLENNCYCSMFEGCASLAEAPDLPATTLAPYCYYRMFYGCTRLAEAPDLPATDLPTMCYYYMFSGCEGIKFSDEQSPSYWYEYTIPAGNVPAENVSVGDYALYGMFNGIMGIDSTPTVCKTYYMKKAAPARVDVSSVSIEESTALAIGGEETLTVTFDPEEPTDKTVTWSSDNEDVATVDADGTVKAVSAGTANITVTATNGTEDTADDKSDTCEVTVYEPRPSKTLAVGTFIEVGENIDFGENNTYMIPDDEEEDIAYCTGINMVVGVEHWLHYYMFQLSDYYYYDEVLNDNKIYITSEPLTTDPTGFYVTGGKGTEDDPFTFGLEAPVTAVTDVLNREFTGVASGASNYSSWENKTGTSGAVYAGNSAGGNDAIQLRPNYYTSGIVVTTAPASGVKVSKITVDWNSNTSDYTSRTIAVYGKNSAYSSAADLYDNNNRGTLIGSIERTSSELTIPNDKQFDYIGLHCTGGAVFLNSITITWGSGSGDTKTDITGATVSLNDDHSVKSLTVGNELITDLTGFEITYGTEENHTSSTVPTEPGDYYAYVTAKTDNANYTGTAKQAFTVEAAVSGNSFAKYTGELTEGDYLITYDGNAMKASVTSSNRLDYETITVSDDTISEPAENIVWHIEKDGNYWTIYNASAKKYAASTGTKSQAALAGSVDDKARWTVSGEEMYEFVNKHNSGQTPVINANLRKNGTYGFACYGTNTGGALTLYKKVEAAEPVDTYMNLTITDGSAIGINFMFDVNVGEPSEYTVSCDGTDYALSELGKKTVNGKDMYYLPIKSAAKNMTDKKTVVVKKGETVVKTIEKSVVDYSDMLLKDSNAASYYDLIKAMLNYGAAAQEFFGYDTEHLANAGNVIDYSAVTIPEKPFTDSADLIAFLTSDNAPVEYYGMNLTLESETDMSVLFNVKSGYTMEEAKAYLAGFTVDDSPVTVQEKFDKPVITIKNIPIGSLLNEYTITKGNFSFKVSVDMYMTAVMKGTDTKLQALCKALYKFYEAKNPSN